MLQHGRLTLAFVYELALTNFAKLNSEDGPMGEL